MGSQVTAASVIAMLIACRASPSPPRPPPPPPPRATVRVAATSCVDPAVVEARLLQVLIEHRAMESGLVLEIAAIPSETATEVSLRAIRSNGDVGLDRRFTLASADCESGVQLLALSVDRWLSAFPEWAAPQLPPPPPTPPPLRWKELQLGGAINAIWRPLGSDGQLDVLADHGARRHRFGGGGLVRASIPQSAGRGRFQQTSFLIAAVWRTRVEAWEMRVAARAGALLVSGIGFAEDASDWLPWWEGAVFGGRRFSWGSIGLEIAATALQHRAVTRDGLVSEDIPLLRIGVSGHFGLRTQKP